MRSPVDGIEPFELLAIKYAIHSGRSQSDNVLGGEAGRAGSDLAYYVWLARRSDRVVVIDTGFGPDAAAARGRNLLDVPAARLLQVGVDAAQVEDVILTHLHYDHAGGLEAFPNARFHVQDHEVSFATGRCMCHAALRQAYDVEDVVGFIRAVYAGRVVFHNGSTELASGLTIHHVGGHTKGLQVVRVWTQRGWVVLASDAAHLYMNLEKRLPFPIVQDVEALLEGYRLLHELASSPCHIVAGHDPLVMKLYCPPSPELDAIAVRLDSQPNSLP